MSAIYTKRFSTKANGLCVVEYKGSAVRILRKDGKRRDFATFGEANRVIWHITNASSKFEWSPWMTKASFNASIQARLEREADAKALADKKAELEDQAELDMEYRRMKRERDAEACGPMELEDSEEDFDDDSHDDGDDDNRGW